MRNLNVTHQILTILGDDVVWNIEKVEKILYLSNH